MIDLKKLRASAEIHLHFNPGMTIPTETILELIEIAEAANNFVEQTYPDLGVITEYLDLVKALSAVRGDSDEHP